MAAEPQTYTINDNIRRVVSMLLTREGRRHRHLAEMLGTTRQTATNKIKGDTRFRADELEILARVFQVDIAVFVDPSRPVPTTPVLPPIPDRGPDLLTCTKYQLGLVRGSGRGRYGHSAKSTGILRMTAA